MFSDVIFRSSVPILLFPNVCRHVVNQIASVIILTACFFSDFSIYSESKNYRADQHLDQDHYFPLSLFNAEFGGGGATATDPFRGMGARINSAETQHFGHTPRSGSEIKV